jgi:hypothetical protein
MAMWEVVQYHMVYHEKLCKASQVVQRSSPTIVGAPHIGI